MNLEHVKKTDIAVAEQIELELKRQQETIELIASENIASKAVFFLRILLFTTKSDT